MRVAIVSPWYPPSMRGGGEVSVQLLATQLQRADRIDAVRVYSFDGWGEETVDSIPVTRGGTPPHNVFELANAYALAWFARHRAELRAFDVLHGYNVALHPTVGLLSSRLDVPSVATLNSYDLLPKRSFGIRSTGLRRLYELTALRVSTPAIRWSLGKIDRCIALSDATRAVYHENGYGHLDIAVVPNMFDPAFAVPESSDGGDAYRLLYVGTLRVEKGVGFLIRALDELPADTVLDIVGDGPHRAALEGLVAERGLTDRVTFHGHVPYAAVKARYSSADAFVHPGIWPEPFGRTLLEAMQAGLPVVATAIGGPAEIVTQPELQCPPRDPAALAEAITAARANHDAVVEENRRLLEERYAPARVTAAIIDLYEQVQPDAG